VFHADRLGEYVLYALGYVGGAVGARSLPEARIWGAGMLATLLPAIVWLWSSRIDVRRALVPWGLLTLFGLGNAFVTSYGRLDNGAHTALLPRYAPTAGLFVASVVAVTAMLTSDVRTRSRAAGHVLLVAVALVVLVAGRTFTIASRAGFDQMAALAARLDAQAPCFASCATATDACLARICWDAKVARTMCPMLERARIGPFRN
jgi:hypothetical protein